MSESTDFQRNWRKLADLLLLFKVSNGFQFQATKDEGKQTALYCCYFQGFSLGLQECGKHLENLQCFSRLISDFVRKFTIWIKTCLKHVINFWIQRCSAPNHQKWRKTSCFAVFLFFSWFSRIVEFSMGVLPIGTSGFVFGHGCAWWVWFVENQSATFWVVFLPTGAPGWNPVFKSHMLHVWNIYQHLP